MLAPFWTDLDGTGAPGIYATTLTDGVSTWIVIEHRVRVWGTTSLRTFQTWIGTGSVQDISFAYPAPPADPAGQPLLYGAENEVGQGDMVAGLPTGDQVVTSTDPAPGDTAGYSLTVRGEQAGTGTLTTEMTATGVPGTTIERDPVVVR